MISKNELVKSITSDLQIVKHLYTKVDPNTLDYRPTPKQRSLLELLRYLTYAPLAATRMIVSGNMADWDKTEKAGDALKFEDIPAALDKTADEVASTINGLSDQQLAEEISLWDPTSKQKRNIWILNLVLKSIVAYKTQLFLYIKANGNDKINTMNLWSGRDGNMG